MHRRHFLRLASTAPLAAALPVHASETHRSFAYLGTPDALHSYRVDSNGWTKMGELPANNPASLVRHPTLPILYATEEIDTVHHRPTGAISTYRITRDGHLTPVQQRPLSLAATRPRAMAISPDGTRAVVAGSGGGTYNLFAMNPDGELGTLQGVLKETGSGPHPGLQRSSHPEHVLFDSAGHILGADPGTDRIHLLAMDSNSLQLTRRYQSDSGSAPAHITLHPRAPFLAISHALDPVVRIHSYDPTQGRIEALVDHTDGTTVPLETDQPLLAIQDGTSVRIHRWSARNGRLQLIHSVDAIDQIQAARLESSRTLMYASVGEVIRLELASGSRTRLACCPGLRCIAWPRESPRWISVQAQRSRA